MGLALACLLYMKPKLTAVFKEAEQGQPEAGR